MTGMRGWGNKMGVILAAILLAGGCGPRNLRAQLLASGAISVSGAIEDATGEGISVLDATFSPGSDAILVQALSLISGTSRLWIYRLADGSLIENGLKPGWTLSSAAFSGDGESLVIAVERPSPPTYRLYQTPVGSDEWANLTDLVPTAYVKVIQIAAQPGGDMLALVSAAEGHTDLTVSRGGERLLETQVYPGYVKIVGWGADGSHLFVESDMPLHLGLTLEKRTKNGAWDESMRDGIDSAVYSINPVTQEVVPALAQQVPSPMISPDGKHRLHLLPVDEISSGLFLTPR